MTDLVLYDQTTTAVVPVPVTESERENLQELWQARKAKNTYRAYLSDMRQFEIWAFGLGLETLPAEPQTVARYLGSMSATKSSATIGRRMASISHFHRERGFADPTKHATVAGLMEGIRRSNAGKPTAAKAAVLTKHLRRGLKADVTRPVDIRNKALLLVGFAGCFRRSELVAIDVDHLAFDEENRCRVMLPKSKTNQTGEPESVWILPGGSHCPVRALRAWLALGRITEGPVFRSVDRHGNVKERLSCDAVAYQVKRFAVKAGLDPKQFSGHSLRAGHVTQAFLSDTPAHLIQRQGRWRSLETVMRYNRDVESMKHNSSSHLGL
jgi:site-specific recombinase XerD